MDRLTKTPLRTAALASGLVAALAMIYLYNPWANPDGDVKSVTTWIFWISAIALLVLLYLLRKEDPESETVEIEGPAFTRYLFSNRRAGVFWLPIRLFLGFEWLEAGWHKLTPTDAQGVTHYFAGTGWLDGGAALMGYWTRAVAVPAPGQGSASITFEWYRSFLQYMLDTHSYSWFAYLIVFGEIAVGLGLLFGALTGIAAFFGALMNMSFLLAGSASVNPVLFTLAIGLILAWKVAGYYGVDRWLLPILGVPWSRKRNTETPASAPKAQPATG